MCLVSKEHRVGRQRRCPGSSVAWGSYVVRIVDRYDEAMQALTRRGRSRSADFERLAHIWTLRGNLHFPRGELELCLDAHRRALDFARRADSVEE